jgi:hypothetical protein
MEDRRVEHLIDNEKEWRRYIVKKVDKIDDELKIFKIKAYTFMGALTIVANVITRWMYK